MMVEQILSCKLWGHCSTHTSEQLLLGVWSDIMGDLSARQITGDDVISELLRNVEVGLFKVRYTVLLPCRFNVYLQQRDFGFIAPVADVVRREAKQALDEYLSRLNTVRRAAQACPATGPVRAEGGTEVQDSGARLEH